MRYFNLSTILTRKKFQLCKTKTRNLANIFTYLNDPTLFIFDQISQRVSYFAHFWTAELPSESFIVPLFNFSVTFRTRKAFSFLSFLYITFSQKCHWLLYIAEEAWILTSFAKCRDRRFFCLLSTTKIA